MQKARWMTVFLALGLVLMIAPSTKADVVSPGGSGPADAFSRVFQLPTTSWGRTLRAAAHRPCVKRILGNRVGRGVRFQRFLIRAGGI